MGPGGDHCERVVLSRAGATPTGANKVGSTLIARVLKTKLSRAGVVPATHPRPEEQKKIVW